MPLKICHISSMHDWHDDRIFQRACKGLVRAGHEVSFIVTYPEDTIIDGVKIIGLKERTGMKRRVFSSYEAYKKALNSNFDLYHFHDPDLLPFMIKLKKKGKKVIYDIHENYVVRMKGRGLPLFVENIVESLWHSYENYAVSKFDGIIPVTESIGNLFRNYAKSSVVISNMVDIELLKDIQIPDPSTKEKLIYCSGNNTPKRNCMQMLEAMPAILKDVPDAKMMFAGQYSSGFDDALRKKSVELGVDKSVEVAGSLPWKENFNRTAKAFIGCVFWTKDENYSITIPARIFEFMFSSVAVLADDTVELRKVVELGNCGYIVNSDHPDQIATAVIKMLKDPERTIQLGRNGREAMMTKFNFNKQLEEMIAFYNMIIASDQKTFE